MKNMFMKAKFGWMKINGDKYQKDIVIHSDGAITKREKEKSKDLKPEYGHTPLSERELEFLQREQFDTLYIGTGHEAALPITPMAQEILDKYHTVILPTLQVIDKI
jgi:hypothetical protein